MDFSFFTTNNKSGYKTREKWIMKNYPELYNDIEEYCKNLDIALDFKEKIWFFFHKLKKRPKCITCGKELKFRGRFDDPYGEFCSLECINTNKDEMILRQKKTFNEKYGVNFYPQHPDFIPKRKKTKLEKYGDENFNNTPKSKKTKKEKYGNPNYVNVEKYKLTCQKKYDADNYSKSNSYQNKIKNNFKLLYPNVNFLMINKSTVSFLCNICGKESEITKQLLYERTKRNYVICDHCNPVGSSFKSGYENEISEFLKEIGIDHLTSDHTLLGKKEIDIYIPNNKIAIEFDGVYWHNELFVSPNYHLEKTLQCQEKNVDLIHIFEDEWLYKKEIVQSIIKNKLNKTDNSIYGRKCVVKNVEYDECKSFLNKNHIQGSVNSSVRLGLYYNNKLVSVMTFSKGRVIMGGKPNEWELNRFCNLINTNVIGAAGKLFQYFVKNYNPRMIISYSDVRLFKGEMYKNLGFIRKSQSKPNYWYVKNGIRYYRFNFRKSILVKEGYDKNKTEKEIMFDRKIYRIYDCGNIRWEYVNKNFTL